MELDLYWGGDKVKGKGRHDVTDMRDVNALDTFVAAVPAVGASLRQDSPSSIIKFKVKSINVRFETGCNLLCCADCQLLICFILP